MYLGKLHPPREEIKACIQKEQMKNKTKPVEASENKGLFTAQNLEEVEISHRSSEIKKDSEEEKVPSGEVLGDRGA